MEKNMNEGKERYYFGPNGTSFWSGEQPPRDIIPVIMNIFIVVFGIAGIYFGFLIGGIGGAIIGLIGGCIAGSLAAVLLDVLGPIIIGILLFLLIIGIASGMLFLIGSLWGVGKP